MPERYGNYKPTCFDNHLDIQWEPSEELEKLYEKRDRINNRIEDLQDGLNVCVVLDYERQLELISKEINALEALEDRNNWIVAPCSVARDSGPLEQSNFESCLEILGGESETAEVHRFGHWAVGWHEIILVHPSREKEVEDIESSLESYPVLNDDDLSLKELEAMQEDWRSWGWRDFNKELLSELESLANEEPEGNDIERELDCQRRLDEFMPNGGMTYRMAGVEPPTDSELLWARIEEIENWTAEQLEHFAFEVCGLMYESLNDGTRFEIEKAVRWAIEDGLFWGDPVVIKEKEITENV